ncbi:MAG TPA: SDR family oxidoreductase [Chitinophaga sp.]
MKTGSFNSVKGKTALITGASSGIGEAFAHKLAGEGCHLVLTARSTAMLQEIARVIREQYKVKVYCYPGDLAKRETPAMLLERVQQDQLHIDILVNNAGFGKWAHFLGESIDTYQDMMQVNMDAVVRLTHLFLPPMLEKRSGAIINIASTGAFQPCPYIAVYCATKAFLLSFSEALYGEYDERGITVTAVCPGNTQTGFFSVANADTTGMKYDTPARVAEEGLKAVLQRKNYKVIGFGNYMQSLSSRFFSRRMIINIVKNMFSKRVQPEIPGSFVYLKNR